MNIYNRIEMLKEGITMEDIRRADLLTEIVWWHGAQILVGTVCMTLIIIELLALTL